MVERGDIIIINFDPIKRHEQVGKRPVLVISNEKFYKIFKLVVILSITNNIKDFPYSCTINKVKELLEDLLEEVLEKMSLIFQ